MDGDFLLYALALAAVVAGIIALKKLAGCIVKTAVLVAILAAAAWVYYAYF